MIDKIIENIDINCQSSIRLSFAKIIYFDPYLLKTEPHDADYIFITHPHYDHFSLEDIAKIANENTIIIAPSAVIKELPKKYKYEEINIGEEKNYGDFSVKVYPSYNINKQFHPKEAGYVGYLLKSTDETYFIPGDSDVIPSYDTLKDLTVLFLPVGGTYTMTSKEASTLANKIKPKLAIPIHYGLAAGTIDDANDFKENLNTEIKCHIFYK